jgi:hypothetical protein
MINVRGRDLAAWLKRLAATAKVVIVLGFNNSILQISGIRGAADEAVLNELHKKLKFAQKIFE